MINYSKLREESSQLTALQRQRTIFIVGAMSARKTHQLLEHAAAQAPGDYHAFRHAIDDRWTAGMIESRDPTFPPIECEHVRTLLPAVRAAFSRRAARFLYIEELHFFAVDDIAATLRWCAVTGVTVVGTGIATEVTTGRDFAYLDLPVTLLRADAAVCQECGQPAHADVLREQADGRAEFAPGDLVGDEQWMGVCQPCHASWVQRYGLPRVVTAGSATAGGSSTRSDRRDLIMERVTSNRNLYHADTTKAVHNAAYTAYRETCAIFEIPMYPITMAKMELLAGELTLRNMKDPQQYIGAVLTVAEMDGETITQDLRAQLRHLYRGLARDRGPAEAMRPLTIEMLRELREHVRSASQAWAWLVFVVCFFWLLRPNELYNLLDSDVVFHDDDQVSIRLNKSKTDPTAAGAVRRIRCMCHLLDEDPNRADGLVLCPWHAARQLKRLAGAGLPKPGDTTGFYEVYDYSRRTTVRRTVEQNEYAAVADPPFLRAPVGRPLDKKEIVTAFYQLLDAAGIENRVEGRDRNLYASHSCRRGGAQCMARGGMTIEEIAKWGRWSYNCVMRYVEEALFESTLIGLRFPLVAQDG